MEKIRGISTKTGLVDSLKTYYEKHVHSSKLGYTVFDSTPTTFILTPSFEGSEYKLFNFSVKSSRNKMGSEAGKKFP